MPEEQAQGSVDEVPVFGSEAEAEDAPGGKPQKYVVDEGASIPLAQPASQPLQQAKGPAPVGKKPRRFRVIGLTEPKLYIEQAGTGKTCRMVPNKVLDERYYNIPFILQQGFNLVELKDDEDGKPATQVGRVL
jgi:hypothetical protein